MRNKGKNNFSVLDQWRSSYKKEENYFEECSEYQFKQIHEAIRVKRYFSYLLS